MARTAPQLPDLFLLRHGQTEWNVERRMQGVQDSPLTPLGVAQARRQAQIIGNLLRLRPDLMRYASPLGRARLTAGIVFAGAVATLDERLVEIDVGQFTGHRIDDLRAKHPDLFPADRLGWYDRTPGGEHFAQLAERVEQFLADLTGPAVIVTHGITLRMLRLVAMGLPIDYIGQMAVRQGAVHVVSAGRHRVWM